jgi:hypothetical protein
LKEAIHFMPYEFTEWEEEPEAQASSSMSGGPPNRAIGTGVMEPPEFPNKPMRRIPQAPSPRLLLIFSALLLAGLAALVLFGAAAWITRLY